MCRRGRRRRWRRLCSQSFHWVAQISGANDAIKLWNWEDRWQFQWPRPFFCSFVGAASPAAAFLFCHLISKNENNNVNPSVNLFLFLTFFMFLFFHSFPPSLCISYSVIKFMIYVCGSRNRTFQPFFSLLTSLNASIHSIAEYFLTNNYILLEFCRR